MEPLTVRYMNFYFWKFVHNAIIHPMLSLPIREENWRLGRMVLRWHDWTAKKCYGAG